MLTFHCYIIVLGVSTDMYPQTAKRIVTPVLHKRSLQPEVKITVGLAGMTEQGFTAGLLTCVEGPHELLTDMVHQLGVRTYQLFHQETVYLDGGYDANPYRIAKYARRMELDQEEVLKHVYISRAFTVYQLSTLVQDSLEKVAVQQQALTVVLGGFPLLYSDGDVPTDEAHQVLVNDLVTLKALARRHHLVVVVTNDESRRVQPTCRELIRFHADAMVRIPAWVMRSPATYRMRRRASHVQDGQTRLDQFREVN